MGKTSFLAYADERLTGFVALTADATDVPSSNVGGSWARRIDTRREWQAFREYYQEYLPRAMPPSAPPAVCEGPISYTGHALLQRDLAALKAALRGARVEEAFVPAIAPGMVGRGQNRYYATEEQYVFAIAEALKTEYRAIVDAGFILQIDDPGLGETWDMMIPAPPLEEYRKKQTRNIDALNHALSASMFRVCFFRYSSSGGAGIIMSHVSPSPGSSIWRMKPASTMARYSVLSASAIANTYSSSVA